MNEYEVSFIDGSFIEAVTVGAENAEDAQAAAIQFWEEQGIVHGDIRIHRKERALPLLPY